MSAIITALQRVTQRSSTFTFVHGNKLKNEEQLLHQLGEVLNPFDSYKKYHEALQDVKPPAFAIPWLGVSSLPSLTLLHRLSFIGVFRIETNVCVVLIFPSVNKPFQRSTYAT
jgi:hypothetical protein